MMTDTRNLKGKFKAIMNSTGSEAFWGGPLWRRIGVVILMFAALGAYGWVSSDRMFQ